MSAPSWSNGTPVRAAAVAACGLAVLAGVTLAGAAHERSTLPSAAQQTLQADIQASAVTTCLQGARDELYVPGVRPLHDREAVAAAERRLQGCDIRGLSRELDAVRLPPAAPVTDSARRRARADVVEAVAVLRRVVLDTAGADKLMRRNLSGAPDGTAIVLAYRSATAGSDIAYRLTEEALALLGVPQSTVNG